MPQIHMRQNIHSISFHFPQKENKTLYCQYYTAITNIVIQGQGHVQEHMEPAFYNSAQNSILIPPGEN